MSRKIKDVYVTFSDDRTYSIPASVIAADRATYFAGVDAARGDGEFSEVYNAEYEYTPSDETELLDWIGNSMDWSEVADRAVLVEDAYDDTDYEAEFSNAPKDITWEDDDAS